MPWVSLPGGNWVLGMPRIPLLDPWVNKMFHTVRAAPVTGLCDACDLRLVEDTRLGLVGEGQAGIRRGRGVSFGCGLNISMTKNQDAVAVDVAECPSG